MDPRNRSWPDHWGSARPPEWAFAQQLRLAQASSVCTEWTEYLHWYTVCINFWAWTAHFWLDWTCCRAWPPRVFLHGLISTSVTRALRERNQLPLAHLRVITLNRFRTWLWYHKPGTANSDSTRAICHHARYHRTWNLTCIQGRKGQRQPERLASRSPTLVCED